MPRQQTEEAAPVQSMIGVTVLGTKTRDRNRQTPVAGLSEYGTVQYFVDQPTDHHPVSEDGWLQLRQRGTVMRTVAGSPIRRRHVGRPANMVKWNVIITK